MAALVAAPDLEGTGREGPSSEERVRKKGLRYKELVLKKVLLRRGSSEGVLEKKFLKRRSLEGVHNKGLVLNKVF